MWLHFLRYCSSDCLEHSHICLSWIQTAQICSLHFKIILLAYHRTKYQPKYISIFLRMAHIKTVVQLGKAPWIVTLRIYYYKKWPEFLRKKTINFELMLFIFPPTNGKYNPFKATSLLEIYFVVITCFYFQGFPLGLGFWFGFFGVDVCFS